MQVFDPFLRNKNVKQQSHENVIEVYVTQQTLFKKISWKHLSYNNTLKVDPVSIDFT